MAVPYRRLRTQPWQRFTLLDMLLLQASVGLGFSLAYSLGPSDAGEITRAIAGVVFGCVLAGPIVLLAQWTVRGRTRPLSAGEWLWLSPPVLLGVVWYSLESRSGWSVESIASLLGIWGFAQATCMGAAVATLVSGWRGYRSTVPCYWTDRTGTWVSLLFGFWVLFFVLPAMLLSD